MWSGRKALVTGASGGIGRAVAVSLAAAGAHVALAGRNETALRETAEQCVVEPGYVATGFNAALIEGGFEERLLTKIPTRRAVSVESVARTVLFAAENVDMTGAVLRVDGGQTVRL